MTIRRQYSLPNCTLVLDGLSDGNSTTGIPDPRPVMSNLFNAECHFAGREQPLFGGREFLTNLVTAVSNYAQEFLSGIHHATAPKPAPDANSLVSLTKGDRENIHYLEATLDPSQNPTIDGKPTQIKLSTVQLFDLLEAIDQFLADRRTLPDIMVPLRPATKALTQPIAAQATPAGLGLASLVVASLIGYALPAPQVSPPKFVSPTPVVAPKTAPNSSTPTEPSSSKTATPAPSTPTPTPTPAATTTLPTKTGRIVEATQVGFLERKLRRDLQQNWQERGQISQPTTFKVSVNQDGEIVNYQPVGKTNPALSKFTPLAKLSTQNTDPNQAIGDFNTIFKPDGTLEIVHSQALQGKMSLGKPITEPTLQATLAKQLQAKLQQSTTSQKNLNSPNLRYRVAVTKTGEIADYEPINQRSEKDEAKTPLPKLAKFNPQAAISQESLAQYNVVFRSNGEVRVTPTMAD